MNLKINFEENLQNIKLQFDESNQFAADFGEVYVTTEDVEYYSGSYQVTPTTEDQVLKTKEKLMLNDLTVCAIPYSEVSNLAGGKTAAIG